MRLWSIHPKYLDRQGLLALWRESLLAQKVLRHQTKGYRNHPQLIRFKNCKNPQRAIASYLHLITEEAQNRGYSFDATKILEKAARIQIALTRGQLEYEIQHLRKKLWRRDRMFHKLMSASESPLVHPIFYLIDGDIEHWERF